MGEIKMSLLIVDIRDSRKGLDTKTEQFTIEDINISFDTMARMHCIILTNGNQFKVLKDRSGHDQVGKVYPLKALIFFIYRYQSDQIEFGSVSASDWIIELARFLDSKELSEMSKTMERLAFEKA